MLSDVFGGEGLVEEDMRRRGVGQGVVGEREIRFQAFSKEKWGRRRKGPR